MDTGLRRVEACLQHLHPGTELDEPILQYIQQLCEQALQDRDTAELTEFLEAYLFPSPSTSELHDAVDYILNNFKTHQLTSATAPDKDCLEQKESHHHTQNVTSSPAETIPAHSSSVAPNVTPEEKKLFSFAKHAEDVDSYGVHSGVVKSEEKGITSSRGGSSTAVPTSSRIKSSSLGSGSLNPNACAFVPRQPTGALPSERDSSNTLSSAPSLPAAPLATHGWWTVSHDPATHADGTYGGGYGEGQPSAAAGAADKTASGCDGVFLKGEGESAGAGVRAAVLSESERAGGKGAGVSGGESAGTIGFAATAWSADTYAGADEREQEWGGEFGEGLHDGEHVGVDDDTEVSEWDMTAQETEAQFLHDAGWGWDGASECTGDQAVAILSYWFPTYALEVLTDVLAANHGNLAKAYAELSTLELDAAHSFTPSSTRSLPRHSSNVFEDKADVSCTPPSLDETHFPSLTTSSPPAAEPTPPPYPTSRTWGTNQNTGKSFAGALQSGLSHSPSVFNSSVPNKPRSHSQPQRTSSKGAAVNVPWVSTGEEVAAQYAAAREEARDHARLRNMCFQQATLAFLSGNKALAKELSMRGRHHSDLMKECHARASQGIFTARNAHLGLGTSDGTSGAGLKSGPANFIDLHGIHASEARSMLDKVLCGGKQGGKAAGARQNLLVCVGTGHHTKVQHARLPQAVEAFLTEKGFTYSYAQPGLIRVVL